VFCFLGEKSPFGQFPSYRSPQINSFWIFSLPPVGLNSGNFPAGPTFFLPFSRVSPPPKVRGLIRCGPITGYTLFPGVFPPLLSFYRECFFLRSFSYLIFFFCFEGDPLPDDCVCPFFPFRFFFFLSPWCRDSPLPLTLPPAMLS